jgi:hypothetical protein
VKKRHSGAGYLLCRDGFQPCAEAGFVPGRRIFVNCALLNGLIYHRNRRPVARLRSFAVAFSDCLAQSAQRCAQSGLVCAVYERTFFGLTGAFKRGKMVCHALLLFL